MDLPVKSHKTDNESLQVQNDKLKTTLQRLSVQITNLQLQKLRQSVATTMSDSGCMSLKEMNHRLTDEFKSIKQMLDISDTESITNDSPKNSLDNGLKTSIFMKSLQKNHNKIKERVDTFRTELANKNKVIASMKKEKAKQKMLRDEETQRWNDQIIERNMAMNKLKEENEKLKTEIIEIQDNHATVSDSQRKTVKMQMNSLNDTNFAILQRKSEECVTLKDEMKELVISQKVHQQVLGEFKENFDNLCAERDGLLERIKVMQREIGTESELIKLKNAQIKESETIIDKQREQIEELRERINRMEVDMFTEWSFHNTVSTDMSITHTTRTTSFVDNEKMKELTQRNIELKELIDHLQHQMECMQQYHKDKMEEIQQKDQKIQMMQSPKFDKTKMHRLNEYFDARSAEITEFEHKISSQLYTMEMTVSKMESKCKEKYNEKDKDIHDLMKEIGKKYYEVDENEGIGFGNLMNDCFEYEHHKQTKSKIEITEDEAIKYKQSGNVPNISLSQLKKRVADLQKKPLRKSRFDEQMDKLKKKLNEYELNSEQAKNSKMFKPMSMNDQKMKSKQELHMLTEIDLKRAFRKRMQELKIKLIECRQIKEKMDLDLHNLDKKRQDANYVIPNGVEEKEENEARRESKEMNIEILKAELDLAHLSRLSKDETIKILKQTIAENEKLHEENDKAMQDTLNKFCLQRDENILIIAKHAETEKAQTMQINSLNVMLGVKNAEIESLQKKVNNVNVNTINTLSKGHVNVLTDFKNTFNDICAERDGLLNKVEVLKGIINRGAEIHQAEITKLQKNNQEQNVVIVGLRNDMMRMQETINKQNGNEKELAQQITVYENEIGSLKTLHKNQIEIIGVLQQKLQKSEIIKTKNQQQNTVIAKSMNEVQRMQETMYVLSNEQNKDESSKESKMHRMQRDNQRQNAVICGLKIQIQRLQETLNQRNEQNKDEPDKLQRNNEQQNMVIGGLKNEVQRLQETIYVLSNDQNEDNAELMQKLRYYEEKIAMLQQKVALRENMIERVNDVTTNMVQQQMELTNLEQAKQFQTQQIMDLNASKEQDNAENAIHSLRVANAEYVREIKQKNDEIKERKRLFAQIIERKNENELKISGMIQMPDQNDIDLVTLQKQLSQLNNLHSDHKFVEEVNALKEALSVKDKAIKDKDSEIEYIKKLNHDRIREIESLAHTMNEKKAVSDEKLAKLTKHYECELGKAKKFNAEYCTEINRLNECIFTMQTQQQKESENGSSSSEILQDTIDALQGDVADLEKTLFEYKQKNEELQNLNADHCEKLMNKDKIIKTKDLQISMREAQICKLEKQTNQIERITFESVVDEAYVLEQHINDEVERAQKRQSSMNMLELKTAKEHYLQQINDLKHEVTDGHNAIVNLKYSLEQAQSENEELSILIDGYEGNIKEKENEIAIQTKIIDDLAKNGRRISDEIKVLKEDDDIKQYKIQIADLKQLEKEHIEQIVELEQKVIDVEKEKEELSNVIERYDQDLKSKSTELKKYLDEKLEDIKEEKQEAKERDNRDSIESVGIRSISNQPRSLRSINEISRLSPKTFSPIGVVAQKLIINEKTRKLNVMQTDFNSRLHGKEEQIRALRESLMGMKQLQINAELREKLEVPKDAIIKDLRASLKKAREDSLEKDKKMSENTANIAKIAELKSMLNEQECDIKQQEKVQRHLVKIINELRKKLKQTIPAIEEENKNDESLSDIKAKYDALTLLLDGYDQNIKDKDAQIEELKRQNEDLHNEIKKLEFELTESGIRQIDEVTAKLAANDEIIKDLRQQILYKDKKLAFSEQLNEEEMKIEDAMQNEIFQRTQKVVEMEQELDDLKRANSILFEQIHQFEAERRSSDPNIKIREMSIKLVNDQKAVKNLLRQIKEKTQDNEELLALIDEYEDDVVEQEKNISQLKRKLSVAEEEKKESDLKYEHEKQQHEICHQTAEMSASPASVVSMSDKITMTEEQSERIFEKGDSRNTFVDKEAMEKSGSDLSGGYAENEQMEISYLHRMNEDKTRHIAELDESLIDLRKKVDVQSQIIKDFEEEHHDLLKQIDESNEALKEHGQIVNALNIKAREAQSIIVQKQEVIRELECNLFDKIRSDERGSKEPNPALLNEAKHEIRILKNEIRDADDVIIKLRKSSNGANGVSLNDEKIEELAHMLDGMRDEVDDSKIKLNGFEKTMQIYEDYIAEKSHLIVERDKLKTENDTMRQRMVKYKHMKRLTDKNNALNEVMNLVKNNFDFS